MTNSNLFDLLSEKSVTLRLLTKDTFDGMKYYFPVEFTVEKE